VGYDPGGPCAGVSTLVEEFIPYLEEEEVSVSYNEQSIKKWVHMRYLSRMRAQMLTNVLKFVKY
jgi:hypothetical protein